MVKSASKQKSIQKRERGRPTSPYGPKKARSLSISDMAYQGIQEIANQHGIRSVSELMEKIGQREIVIDSVEENREKIDIFADIPVVRQLQAVIERPNAAIDSLIAFTTRVSGQLGLPQTSEATHEVILRAMEILFCLNYLSPDTLIDGPTAWLRWYILNILERRYISTSSQIKPKGRHFQYKTEENLTEHCVSAIFAAREELLRDHEGAHLNALKLRIRPYNFSVNQIERITKAQDIFDTGFELVVKGMTTFRRLWLREDSCFADIGDNERAKPHKALKYCNLVQKERLTAG